MAFGELQLPSQMYRTLCQNAECRAPLGGIHIPCGGGYVVYGCHACGTISAFENTATGYVSKVVGRMSHPRGNTVRPRVLGPR